ncbi:MAG: amidohydrolase [Oscillospiraceae bacterium]|nr:amidohydrolase [Oscillospiraceae bacterium]
MIRFFNGKVLKFKHTGPRLTNEEVWVDGDKIVYVGHRREDMPHFDREIDLMGDVLMPGFKNAHTHSAMTFLRSYADDMPLQSWLFDKVFPHEARLTGPDIYVLSKLAIMEYLTSGITASFDMYFFNDEYVRANIDCGFRTVLCGSVAQHDSNPYKMEDEYIKFNDFHPLISYKLGYHAEYTLGDKLVDYVAGLAKKYHAPVFAHNSETLSEVSGSVERRGLTPTKFAEANGFFDYGGGGFHCVHMTDDDLAVFKRHGLWAVTNPASNAKLASGIAPLQRMIDADVNMAIGTDGPASNNALDMFREMYMATALQKLRESDPAVLPAEKVLEMACVGSARAMGLDNCDGIAPQKQADLIVINLRRPNMQPPHNIVKNIVYAGSKENVRLTMVAGKILYENGEFFIGEKAEDIYASAAKAAKRLTKPL